MNSHPAVCISAVGRILASATYNSILRYLCFSCHVHSLCLPYISQCYIFEHYVLRFSCNVHKCCLPRMIKHFCLPVNSSKWYLDSIEFCASSDLAVYLSRSKHIFLRVLAKQRSKNIFSQNPLFNKLYSTTQKQQDFNRASWNVSGSIWGSCGCEGLLYVHKAMHHTRTHTHTHTHIHTCTNTVVRCRGDTGRNRMRYEDEEEKDNGWRDERVMYWMGRLSCWMTEARK